MFQSKQVRGYDLDDWFSILGLPFSTARPAVGLGAYPQFIKWVSRAAVSREKRLERANVNPPYPVPRKKYMVLQLRFFLRL